MIRIFIKRQYKENELDVEQTLMDTLDETIFDALFRNIIHITLKRYTLSNIPNALEAMVLSQASMRAKKGYDGWINCEIIKGKNAFILRMSLQVENNTNDNNV